MSEHSKQPSNSGVGGLSVTPDVKSSVLTDVTNSLSSRSPRASGKLPAVQHDQLPDAQSSTGPTLLITSRDSPIPAHLVMTDVILWRSMTPAASLHPQMMTIRHPMTGAAVTAALTARVAVALSLVPHSTKSGSASTIMVLILQMIQVHQ